MGIETRDYSSSALFYAAEGYILKKGVISEDLCSDICETLRMALIGKRTEDAALDLDALLMKRESEDHDLVYRAVNMVGSSFSAYRFLAMSGIAGLVEGVSGIARSKLHFMPMAIQAQLPSDERFDYKWHQESRFYPWCPTVINLWVPLLRPTTVATGTMTLIPRSHIGGAREAGTYFSYKKFRQIEPSVAEDEESRAISIEAAPGDCLMFDANTIHGTKPNQSALPRLVGIIRAINSDDLDEFRPLYKALSFD